MKKGLLATILLGLVLVLAACGGNGDSNPHKDSGDAASTQNLDIIATNFEFDQEEYTVNAGEAVKVTLTNDQGMHGITIDGLDVNIDGEGETTFTPDKPGEYNIICSIPCGQGHDEMISTLIVK